MERTVRLVSYRAMTSKGRMFEHKIRYDDSTLLTNAFSLLPCRRRDSTSRKIETMATLVHTFMAEDVDVNV